MTQQAIALHAGHHGHSHFSGGVLSQDEKRSTARLLTIAMISVGLLALGLLWRGLTSQDGISQLLLGASSIVVGVPVIKSGWDSLRHPSLHGITDQLIVLAMFCAWATGDLLTAALLPIIMTFGHVLEERSVIGAWEAIEALGRMTASRARLVRPDGSVHEIDNASLQSGDKVEVRAGDRIPADGRVLVGEASLDTAPITGESIPLEAIAGMNVFGGSINIDGLIHVEVTRTGEASTLGQIIALMQEAERSKPPITRLLERYAGHYLLLVLLVAAVTWFVSNESQAMLAVLVAACPCALVLSAPATAVASIAVAARHGILIRSPAFLEEFSDLNSLIIDKTGTLTFGALIPRECVLVGDDSAEKMSRFTQLAASLGSVSSHPVSRALADLADRRTYFPLENIQEVRGLGVIAQTPLGRAALGRAELFDKLNIGVPGPPKHDGPIAGLALDNRFLGWMLLADSIRPEAAQAMLELRELGFGRQVLLTGDRREVAEIVAREVGISDVLAERLPTGKLDAVVAEIQAGFRPLVVGDGINDSLALKAGVVGVAMGAGAADVAHASSDIVLIGGDLRRLGTCVRLSRRCRRVLQTNVAIGLGWTTAIVIMASFGMLGAAGAMIAAVLHNVSTLFVLGNAGRLLRFNEQHQNPNAKMFEMPYAA